MSGAWHRSRTTKGHQASDRPETWLTDIQKRTPGLGLIVLCVLVRSVMVGTSVHRGGLALKG
jgi:hypothetical protein